MEAHGQLASSFLPCHPNPWSCVVLAWERLDRRDGGGPSWLRQLPEQRKQTDKEESVGEDAQLHGYKIKKAEFVCEQS